MILESVENGPLLWPTFEENGVTRPKKYSELSATEAIQVDCDVKATNIILQDFGLIVPVFQKGDDPIHPINHMMSFLTGVVTSRILADPRIVKAQTIQYVITNNVAYQADDLDAYDSDCDELNSAKIALMANLSHYGFDNLAESETKITSDSNIIPYSQYDNRSVNETLTTELERYKDQVRILKEGNNVNKVSDSCAQSMEIDNLKQTLLEHLKEKESNSVNSKEPNLSTRPIEVEVPEELPKVSMVNLSLKKLKYHLASFDVVVKEKTTTTAITEGTWGFEHTKACFKDEIIPFVKALKDLFNLFDQFLIDELSEVQNVFNQIKQAVEQHRVESNRFQDKMKELLNENERLLEQEISKDIMNIVVTANVNNVYETVNECEKCVTLETELQKDFMKTEC
nr:hypothetical protein [Tanacetum cinerariifolium]